MDRPTRREFLEALGLVPFAVAATAAAAKTPAAPSSTPTATPPEDPLKALKEFPVPDGAEPALVFHASRAEGKTTR